MNKYTERLYNGIIKENPTLVLMLGMCPTLAVSTQAFNGIGMGVSTTAVLILSNLVISALRKLIPGQVRLPAGARLREWGGEISLFPPRRRTNRAALVASLRKGTLRSASESP